MMPVCVPNIRHYIVFFPLLAEERKREKKKLNPEKVSFSASTSSNKDPAPANVARGLDHSGDNLRGLLATMESGTIWSLGFGRVTG